MKQVIIKTPLKIKNNLSDSDLTKICEYTFNTTNYSVEVEERKDGNYIQLISNKSTHYVIISGKKASGRNSFLSQFVVTVLQRWHKEKIKDKKISAYLLDTSSKAKTKYMLFIYKCLKTIGIDIINENELNLQSELVPFESYMDFRKNRLEMTRRGNNSSFFDENSSQINFFAKVFGANGKESTLLCLAITRIVVKPIKLYQVKDNESRKMNAPDIELLKMYGVEVDEEIIEEYSNGMQIANKNVEELRNTPKFHYNLFKKYGDKKCYLCECNIDKLIVGAHIHRVTDIKKDSSIDDDEKGRQVIDGDNGLWLCSNHDKLFEWGVIYFDNDTLTINLEEVTESQKRFIEELTTNSQIETKHFNKNMNNYLLKHRSRFRKSF